MNRLLVLSLCVGLWTAPATRAAAPAKTYEIQAVIDAPYYQGPGEHPKKHKLDLYLPRDCENFPVVMFVHGGAWRHGDKDFLGIYIRLGKSLARQGIGVAIPNYRLSPSVHHPEHIKDVARAFAWLHRNVGKHHGDPDRLFVCGHSAGGHLAALLATNDKFLKAEGLDLAAIKGVIPLSGVYKIPEGSFLFDQAFTKDIQIRKDASPIEHVHGGLPPFLIIYADNEMPYCGKEYAEAFCKSLQEKKCTARSLEVALRNHMSLIVNAAKPDDPVAEAFRDFIGECCKLCPKKAQGS